VKPIEFIEWDGLMSTCSQNSTTSKWKSTLCSLIRLTSYNGEVRKYNGILSSYENIAVFDRGEIERRLN
jgi:hypothetical protein